MDERYQFVRGEPFDGLDDYASSPKIRVKNKKLTYNIPEQPDLPGYYYQEGLKRKLGTYFEILAQGMYGGKLYHNEILSPQIMLFTGTEEVIQPDLTLGEGKYKEVKSVERVEPLKLYNKQMRKYLSIVKNGVNCNGNNISPPELDFEIFRHGVGKLFKNFRTKSLDELVEKLSLNMRFMLSLPPQIVFLIYQDSPYTSKYGGGPTHPPCSKFSSPGINSLLAYPSETLAQLGLNPEDFMIRKRRFPEGVTMNGFEINPFPILMIKDRNYEEWLEKLKNPEEISVEEESSGIDYAIHPEIKF
jgi:hypothetical protein